MTKITIKDTKKRHGNCVPFILINNKTGDVTYKGSLKEIAGKLKISPQSASSYHQRNIKVKGKYTIKRIAFSDRVVFA